MSRYAIPAYADLDFSDRLQDFTLYVAHDNATLAYFNLFDWIVQKKTGYCRSDDIAGMPDYKKSVLFVPADIKGVVSVNVGLVSNPKKGNNSESYICFQDFTPEHSHEQKMIEVLKAAIAVGMLWEYPKVISPLDPMAEKIAFTEEDRNTLASEVNEKYEELKRQMKDQNEYLIFEEKKDFHDVLLNFLSSL